MTIPVWVLLFFALWTLLTLVTCVGVYRLGKIYTGRSPIRHFSFPDIERSDWHRRAMRAHLNCVENLAVYGALVVVMVATGISAPILNKLAIIFLVFRVLHTLVHLSFKQTGKVTSIRFFLFTAQLICLFWMGIFIATHV